MVNIHDAKINEHVELPDEGIIHPENHFIDDLSKIKHDSPELLEKAKKINRTYIQATYLQKDITSELQMILKMGQW